MKNSHTNGKSISFFEVRRIYVDSGIYDDQFLEQVKPTNDGSLIIRDCKLSGISSDSLQFETHIEIKKENNMFQRSATPVKFWIEKSKLDGFIIRL